MTAFEFRVLIYSPIGEVFEFLMNPDNNLLWQSQIQEVTVEPPGPVGVGTHYHELRRFLGRRFETVFEVTEHLPPKRSSIEAIEGPFPARAGYELVDTGDGTELALSVEMEAAGFFKLAEPVFIRIFRREMAASLGILKDLLEAGVRAPNGV